MESEGFNMHLKLMIPGPIELENEVLDQMGAPVQAHYGAEWVPVHNETIDLLQQVFGTTGKVFMLPGSGSLALDAVIHSTFAPGDRIAVGMNGFFGTRLQEVLAANGIDTVKVEASPGDLLDPKVFEKVLANDPTIRGVAAVHLETSTAVLNPVRAIAEVARAHNSLMMADAVSSLGGTPLNMDEWGIDLCVSASQKGLGGAAGLGIAAVGPRAWTTIEQNAAHARSWYLDLRRWQWYVENWGDWHPFPITMPTVIVLGLRCALRSLLGAGLDHRLARYEILARRLRDGLADLDMALFVPEDRMAPVLTAAYCPPGVSSGDVIRYLEQEHHIKITAGFGEFKERVIRIGHMGGAITEQDIDDLLAALRAYLQDKR
ncbi:MAG: alanine--glyoxylate aminotransferase family protein [Chloroflexi bacterium]|nr:MAG: alanine--glyoxylate aminotransferase family protein [Chloroflexota bacterium]